MMMIKKQLTGVTTTVIRPRPLIPIFLLVSIFFFILFLVSRPVFVSSSFFLSFSVSYSSSPPSKNSPDLDKSELTINRYNSSENTIRCDRKSSSKYDICYMKGDIRTVPSSSSIILYNNSSSRRIVERIRPYPRKWESVIMDTVDEVSLQVATRGASAGDSGHNSHACDVYHSVPAVVFYTGGYTGNLFHEFNDGILPLYITAQHFNKQVVFVILKYHSWWISKYNDILFQLSDYPPIDFYNDSRTHCFPEMTVGLRAHDELSIDSTQSTNNKTIFDFRRLLEIAYRSRLRSLTSPIDPLVISNPRPKITIVSRTGARGIENEGDFQFLCEKVGFQVKIIKPSPTTDLADMYKVLNDTDVMVGVHGAALTHFLFLRPGSVFIQIVPLGNVWVAELCFGKAARRMGMEYVEYKIKAEESSLYRDYGKDDPVVRQPEKVAAERGWKVIKEVYLDGQSVKLDLNRFGKLLVQIYNNRIRKF